MGTTRPTIMVCQVRRATEVARVDKIAMVEVARRRWPNALRQSLPNVGARRPLRTLWGMDPTMKNNVANHRNSLRKPAPARA